MGRRLLLCLLLGASLLGASLLGTSRAARADDDTMKAARKLAEMNGMVAIMTAQAESLVGFVRAAITQTNPRQGTEIEDVIEQFVAPTVQKNIPALLDATTQLYAATFTREEIAQMIAFYETPVGQKIVKTQSQLQQSGVAAGIDWGKRVLAEMGPELKKKLDERSLNPPPGL